MRLEKITEGGTTVTILHSTPRELPAHRAEIDEHLLRDGAVVLRGLDIGTPEEALRTVTCFGDPLDSYRGGNTPRTRVSAGVFTSTAYPAQFDISLHNELSYAQRWPERLYFCCLVAAETGGATPVCDGRALVADLDPAVRERFETRGVLYQQHLHGGYGFGKSWQETFETENRGVVERFLEQSHATYEWTVEDGLRVSQHRPGVRRHPVTGEIVWFNQADQWHPSNLPAEDAEAMLALVGTEDDLPQWVTYGDGSRIPDEDLDQVRLVADRHKLVRPWRPGDLMLIDNMLIMHGREAYTGQRRIVVSMT